MHAPASFVVKLSHLFFTMTQGHSLCNLNEILRGVVAVVTILL